MKRKYKTLIMVLATSVLFSACSLAKASSTLSEQSSAKSEEASSVASEASSVTENSAVSNEESTQTKEIYRGVVEQADDGKSILVVQQTGYNYGQASIAFNLPSDAAEIKTGSFVEVEHNGMLTRSIPPQGNALKATVIAENANGIIFNGTIKSVEKTDDGYSIQATVIGAQEVSEPENISVLLVPMEALENITQEELVAGAQISAVTKGIAALSMPPQLPCLAIMPYDYEITA